MRKALVIVTFDMGDLSLEAFIARWQGREGGQTPDQAYFNGLPQIAAA